MNPAPHTQLALKAVRLTELPHIVDTYIKWHLNLNYLEFSF